MTREFYVGRGNKVNKAAEKKIKALLGIAQDIKKNAPVAKPFPRSEVETALLDKLAENFSPEKRKHSTVLQALGSEELQMFLTEQGLALMLTPNDFQSIITNFLKHVVEPYNKARENWDDGKHRQAMDNDFINARGGLRGLTVKLQEVDERLTVAVPDPDADDAIARGLTAVRSIRRDMNQLLELMKTPDIKRSGNPLPSK